MKLKKLVGEKCPVNGCTNTLDVSQDVCPSCYRELPWQKQMALLFPTTREQVLAEITAPVQKAR